MSEVGDNFWLGDTAEEENCAVYGHKLDGKDRDGVDSCYCGAVKYPNGLQKAIEILNEKRNG